MTSLVKAVIRLSPSLPPLTKEGTYFISFQKGDKINEHLHY